MRAIDYLAALNPEAASQFMTGTEQVVPFKFETPLHCIECLQAFIAEGVNLRYLFEAPKVWGSYLKSISEERYHKALDMLLELGTPQDLVDYLCVMYKCGTSVIPDAEYDGLEKLYVGTYPQLEYLMKQTPDDSYSGVVQRQSVVVVEAVKMSTVRSTKLSQMRLSGDNSSYAALNAEKSTSIKPVRSYQEAYDFLCGAPKCRTHWSLKMDGINTKCLVSDGQLDVALSRGRAADGWDYTEAVRRAIAAQHIDISGLSGKVTGESLVDHAALPILRQKYSDKEYKSPKSAAGAMLRAPQKFDISDYGWLKFYPFEIEDLPKDEAFAKLRSCGFNIPPEIIFEAGVIPLGNLDEFSAWLDANVFDPLWEAGGGHQNMTDGVVLQLLTNIESDRNDKYSDLNIALKFSHWAEQEYTSVVTNILLEQQRVYMSVVLEIEPVVTRDLNTATRVSVGSTAILIKDNVRIGDKIRFARKSEAINVYLGRVM